MAQLAWTMVINYLQNGERLLDLIFEANDNLLGSESGTMLYAFHYAVWRQIMEFIGGKSCVTTACYIAVFHC